MLKEKVMTIVIKENQAFGKYYGYLANENETPLELPSPLNVSATQYTGDAENIIRCCKRDAKAIFNYYGRFAIIEY